MGGTVAGGLGGVGQRLDRAAVDEIHRQNVGRAELIVGHRQAEFVAPRQIGGIEAHLRGLVQIIGLGMQLAARLVHQGGQVDPLRHQAGDAQQKAHIVDVAVDAVAHAGILHLDRQVAPVAGLRAVHLPDRCRRDRPDLKAGEMAQPARPPGPVQHRLQLLGRHRIGIGAQPRHDLRQFGGQKVTGLHRHQLAHLHRGAAHLGQLPGQAGCIRGGQEQVLGRRPLPRRQLPRALRQGAAAHSARQPPKAQHPRQAALRYGAGGAVFRHDRASRCAAIARPLAQPCSAWGPNAQSPPTISPAASSARNGRPSAASVCAYSQRCATAWRR